MATGWSPLSLRNAGQGLQDVSDDARDSIAGPLAASPGGNEDFASVQTLVAVADAWEAEVGDVASALWAAGDKLRDTAAEYERVDASAARCFEQILRGS